MEDTPVMPAGDGSGPLLQRDYWAVVEGCRGSSADVARILAQEFPRFPPPDLVRFRRVGGDGPLEVGDRMDVDIRLAGTFGVTVVHRDDRTLTLATLEGHPEAGRITFGAYPNPAGEIVVHIRSRARAGSASRYAAFLTAGEPMQTLTWTGFLDRLAAAVGEGVRDAIHADSREVEEGDADRRARGIGPTFKAEAG